MSILLPLLLVLQLAATAGGFYFLWRRLDRAGGDIERLTAQLGEKASVGSVRRMRGGGATPVSEAPPLATPTARAVHAWNLRRRSVPLSGATLTQETGRTLTMAAAVIAPALGFFFGFGALPAVATGLVVAAGIILVSLRPLWRAGAWAAVIAAAAWASAGLALGVAHEHAIAYSLCVSIAASAGLAHAHLRRASPGITLALTMTGAVLAFGTQIGMISGAGAAFAVIVAVAAIIGSATLRLEPVHIGAFGAALLGLYILSGQETAAIWFTPVAAWTGALFLAIATVRVPQLGSRGAAIAGTGALAPLATIAALHFAGHGLADNYAAAAAFAGLALMLAGITALAALRRDRGVSALRVTLWVLVFGAFLSLAGAITTALPMPLQAPAFALTAVGLLALHLRTPDPAWRVFAVIAGVATLLCAGVNTQLLLDESGRWPDATLILAGLAAPAAFCGAAAHLARRNNAPASAAIFEIITFALGVVSANLFTRLAFSGGATLLQPIGFVEIGMHCVVWLIAALLIGSRTHLGAHGVREAATNLLTLTAFATMAFACGLWMASFWGGRGAGQQPLLSHDTMGFLLPAIFFWAHWVFWRARGAHAQTRLSLAAGAVLLAAFVTVEAMRAEHLPEWVGALVGALSFSVAIVINFAPGVVNTDAPARRRDRAPSKSVRQAAP